MKKKKLSEYMRLESIAYGTISFAIFILIWYLVSQNEKIGLFFPEPLATVKSFWNGLFHNIGRNTLPMHILYSLRRVGIGYLIAVILGIPLGLIMACSRLGRAFFMPLFSIIRPIPGLAWIPIAILWFGLGDKSKYFLICMTAIVIITIQTYNGALYVEQTLIGAAKMLGANKYQVFLHVIIPSAIPQIFTGLQSGFAGAWCAVIAAEMICSSEGTGWIIYNAMNYANTTQVIVGMLAIGLVGLTISSLLKVLERKLCAWNIQGK